MATMLVFLMCPGDIGLALTRRRARAVPAARDDVAVRLLPPWADPNGITSRAETRPNAGRIRFHPALARGGPAAPTSRRRRSRLGTACSYISPAQRKARDASSAPPLEGSDDRRYHRRVLRRTAAGGSRRGYRMIATAVPGAPGKLAAESRWAVETHGLTKRFGAKTAVNGVELLVPRGSAFGYLGPNGAGKTTLIRVLLGLTRADAGTMSLLGYPVPRHRDVALARVGAIVDEPRFHRHLTGRQNLRLLAAAREPAARDRIGPALERAGLAHRADDRVSGVLAGDAPATGGRRLPAGRPRAAPSGRADERARPGRNG